MFKTIKSVTIGFIIGVIGMLAFIQYQLPKSFEMIGKEIDEVTREEN